MERLTEKLPDGRNIIRCHHDEIFNPKYGHFIAGEAVDKLAEYEDAEELGLLLRLPVAEGAEVFVIDFIYECKHQFNCPVTFREYRCEEGEFCEHQYKKHIVKSARFNYAMMKKLGETVFLTREEAESALAEKGGAE